MRAMTVRAYFSWNSGVDSRKARPGWKASTSSM
jgi:hypothetical protein